MLLFNSLQSEWIKRKRSAVSWLTIVGSLFIPAIILIARLVYHNEALMDNSSEGIWMKLYRQNWQFMAVFVLPMGIMLVASLITQLEYRNNTWKQVYTSPQSFSTIFWSKFIVVLIVLVQFFILFSVGIYLTAMVPAIIYSKIPFPKDPFPFDAFLSGNLKYFIYCLPVLALQYFMSTHIKNFIIPIGIGLALLIAALIAGPWKYNYLIPYSYLPMTFVPPNGVNTNADMRYWAIGYFVLFTFLNYLLFIHRNRGIALFDMNRSKKKKFLISLLVIAGLGLLALFALPFKIQQSKNNVKVSAGEISQNIKHVEENLGAFTAPDNKDWTIVERMKHYKIKGLSIAVVHNYQIEWTKSYGFADEALKIPINEKTLFIPGSISKSLNAFALMKLVQEKKIDLFKDINTYLSSWKFPYDSVSKGKKISLVNLLNHSAGLSVHGFAGYREGDTLPGITQILYGKKPANSEPVRSIFEPGVKTEYSGGGVMISQLILTDVAKQPYDQFMGENILKPIGMQNSFFTQPLPLNKRDLAASGYNSSGTQIIGKYPVMVEQAAAGLWTTATDLCKFIIEIQLSLKGEGNKILTKETTELMLTPYLDTRSALGFFIEYSGGEKYFGHGAENRGFSGVYSASFEEGNGLAILINSENADILGEIRSSVIDVYGWKGFPKKEVKKTITIPDSVFQKYAGTYTLRHGATTDTVSIYKKDNVYWGKWSQNAALPRKMCFDSDTTFYNMEIPSSKEFIKDKNRKVTGFKVKTMGGEHVFSKIK